MEAQHTSGRMIRKTISALVLAAAPALLWAQVSLYQYSESVEAYTDITSADGGYSLGVPTFWPPVYNMRAFVDPNNLEGTVTNGYLNGATGPGFPIGFDLAFNGDVFDRVGISNCGWISFGKSSDANQAVWTYSSDHPHGRPFVQYYGGPPVPYQRNRVAGWASSSLYTQDMSSYDPPGPVTSLRIATIGATPNRVCVIQWKDYLIGYPPTSTRVNFQIRLNEAENSVEVRYGQMIYSGGEVQVGLGGRIPEDFNSRMTVYEEPAFLYDWNTTVAGVLNTDACMAAAAEVGQPNGSGIVPDAGRTFKWTPDACPPPAWPLTIADLSFDYALAQWEATAAGNYEYFLTDTNYVNGPEVTSGTVTDPEASLFGLQPATTYYLFVRSICGGQPGVWSVATKFLTHGGGLVVCDGGVVTEDYCSHQYDVVYWLYSSADGSPLKIELDSGFVGNAGNESFKIYDGSGPTGTPLQPLGDISGYALTAASGNIYIVLTTDAGACEAQPWYLPLQWRVGCKNCTDPLVNYALGTVDCANQQYYVDVNVFSLGSSTTLVLENSLGLPPTTVSSTGVQAVGPFPSGDAVVIRAQNPDNLMCYSTSADLVNEPCAVVDCGPTWYERCASAGEVREWLLQGDGQAISLRFPPVYMGWDAEVKVFDGADELATPIFVSASGQTNNQIVTSTNPGNQLYIRYEASVYNDYACSAGNSLPLKFVAECAAGCEQPAATFVANCLTTTQYQVVATITAIGSSGSVTITNNAGAAAVVANAPGDYPVGPFVSGTPVTLEVEGANEVCTWTSSALTKDCSSIGIAESAIQQISLFPNPNSGSFSIDLPVGMGGVIDLKVFDPTGRIVSQQQLKGNGRVGVDLGSLPNGFYSLLLHSNGQVANQRFSVQH